VHPVVGETKDLGGTIRSNPIDYQMSRPHDPMLARHATARQPK
jgi:hypothetical protein